MEATELDKYGNLPEHVRRALLATDQQPSDEQPQPEQPNTEQVDEKPQVAETPTQPQTIEPSAEPEHDNHDSHDSNDVKSWKGRLNKEQAAHKTTSEKLLAEVEARQKAEAQAKASQEKLADLEQQLAAKQAEKPQEPAPAEQTTPPDDVDFTEAELGEIELAMGATGRKLAEKIRKFNAQTPAPQPDVNQVVEQRFSQWQQQQEQQSKIAAFNSALNEQVPELQGLMTNSAFTQFLETKVIDFMGNTAAGLAAYIGREKRIDMIPQFRALIDEFNQQQQPPKPQVTQSPSNKGAAMSRTVGKGKKPLTPEVQAQMRFLMNTGQVDKLKELQDQYEID